MVTGAATRDGTHMGTAHASGAMPTAAASSQGGTTIMNSLPTFPRNISANQCRFCSRRLGTSSPFFDMAVGVRVRPQHFLRVEHALTLQLLVQVHLPDVLAPIMNVPDAEIKSKQNSRSVKLCACQLQQTAFRGPLTYHRTRTRCSRDSRSCPIPRFSSTRGSRATRNAAYRCAPFALR